MAICDSAGRGLVGLSQRRYNTVYEAVESEQTGAGGRY